MDDKKQWETLSAEEKKIELFLRQKHTLDLFLERHAISQAQYDKTKWVCTTLIKKGCLI